MQSLDMLSVYYSQHYTKQLIAKKTGVTEWY